MPPLHVVCGWMRSLTSAIMRGCEEGGMTAVYRLSRETMRLHYADKHYDPNIGGLYELAASDYRKLDFPRGFEGKLIKCLHVGPTKMAYMPGGIKVVFMHRDFEEQRQSYMAFFPCPVCLAQIKGQIIPPGVECRCIVPTVEQIEHVVKLSIEGIKNRKDTELLEVQHRDVMTDPFKAFSEIRNFFGVDFDVEVAASTINDTLWRYRRENLTVGIV